MPEINEKFLQIRGKVAIDIEHNLGDDIPVIVTVTSVELKDTDKEAKDIVYKARLFDTDNSK